MPSLTGLLLNDLHIAQLSARTSLFSFDYQSFKQPKWQFCGYDTDLITQFNKHFSFGVRFFFLSISFRQVKSSCNRSSLG